MKAVLPRFFVALGVALAFASCAQKSGLGGTSRSANQFSIDEPAGTPEGYELVWADEFDRDGLPDPSKWAYDTGANPTGWYNDEKQYYAAARSKNSRVENGTLILEAHKESAAQFADAKPSDPQGYTSARLITRGKASWTYGYFEVRAKLPLTQGAWPAIWMLADSASITWPQDGEIDIMEHVNSEDKIHFSIHTAAHNHNNNTQATNSAAIDLSDGEFHTYHMTWTPEEIKIGFDGRNYLSYKNEGKDYRQWPFDSPQFLILNVAVGGVWPKDPDASSKFPMRMEVEYVRVYQKK